MFRLRGAAWTAAVTSLLVVSVCLATGSQVGIQKKGPGTIFQRAPITAQLQGRQGEKVQIDLQTFTCINADEDSAISDGDEPYLIPVAVFVDGNTVSLQTIGTSTAFLMRAPRIHGNLNRKNVRGGERFSIPTDTGRFSTGVLPINTNGLADPEGSVQVGILVLACEQDGTNGSVIATGVNTLVSTLQAELNKAIQTLSQPDIKVIQDKIFAAVKSKMTKATLKTLNLMGAIDPDGIIGVQFVQYNLKRLKSAGAAGIPIFMDFNDTDAGCHYQVEGRIGMQVAAPVAKTIRVTVNMVQAIDDLEGFGMGDPDFQARISIDRQVFNTPEKTGKTIRPNWTVARASNNPSVPVLIELFEKDWPSADERCDINPKKGVKPLSLFVNPATGAISGDVSGQVGVPITVAGAGDSDKCRITFTITAL